ncbi:MAG: flagellar biosynthetic protein FliO [Rhodospirillales bacterium]
MDVLQYFQAVAALGFVLGLIGLAFFLAKRYGIGYAAGRGPGGARGRRLGIVEVVPLDAKRRLILVRRDDREHLVLIGGGADCVVETGIALPENRAPVDKAKGEGKQDNG